MLRMPCPAGVAAVITSDSFRDWSPGRNPGCVMTVAGCGVKFASNAAGAVMIGSKAGLVIVRFRNALTKWTDLTMVLGANVSVPVVVPVMVSGAPPAGGEVGVPKNNPFTWAI